MTIGFTGSRDYPRPDLVENFVRALARKYPDAIVTSGGRGNVDETAENTAVLCGLEVVSYRPTESTVEIWRSENGQPLRFVSTTFDVTGKPNSFVRNCFARNWFIAHNDRLIGFWDGKSRGTADTISKGRSNPNREVFVYDAEGVLQTPVWVAQRLTEVFGR